MVFLFVRFVPVDDGREVFAGLVVGVGMLVGLSEEGPARVVGW